MLVKCQICGNKVDKSVAYKRIVNSKNWYCCSAQEYVDFQTEKEKKKAIRNAFNDMVTKIWGYTMINTRFYKEKTEWLQIASEETITKYMQENEAYLSHTIAQLDGTEFAKIRYFSAILKNSLRDFKPKQEEQPKPKVVVEEIMYEAPARTLNKRRSLADLEEDV